ncbi:ABC transporter permease [Trinickia caryophylli]|uniref:Histidine/lysine/arginine/ornithine transport system permease protein HisM n=1 Tax=Trinickia caryophylli TaxID=28094 RepID=A0A1X7GZ36_TRICW|nr:ABC transporter permease [Trinickia caryophylli]PMS10109.1 histidine ABC transporter permease HisM [Trinickia caryophylli]TRX18209.1 ABC transporter permease [Trinickia caryophylli]WQE11003.1 ABC transporter permease [Trinickia caryophylli]SMF76832.1 amino acid ABC transporter membrane protein 2, PAAT family [Trinickia caryophylli]GLU35381.1 histidine/lysine/arginine/ornithine ABC transporter permease HisM [Trinickia caryophylli]
MIELIQEYWRNYLFTDGYRFTGLAITLWLLVVSIGIGFCLSVPLAVARVSTNRFVSGSVWLYTYIFRGTPLYVQLLLCYSGIYSLQVVHAHAPLDEFFRNGMNCTLLAFTLNTCAYTTEIFAGAIKATAYGEIEAARAYGMSRFAVYRRIVLPSALRRALPLYSNEVILMLHATTVAFTATVPDILKIARDVNSATYMSFQAFGIAALLYLIVSFALVGLFRRAEQHWLAYLRPQGK